MLAGKFTRLVLAVAIAAGSGVVAGIAASTLAAVPALAGNPGGKLTVATVMARAQWWMNTYGVVYSMQQSAAKSDGDGETYRPDCSGFVSMVWHLPKKSDGWDRYTGDLAGFGDTTWLSSLDVLAQGDAILGVAAGHVALFDRWADSSRSEMWVYEEYDYGKEGRYVKKSKQAYINAGYRGLHYNKITNDGWGTPAGQFCQYKVTSGSVSQRSGPGNVYTSEGTFTVGQTFWAALDKTVAANGFTYRRFTGGRLGLSYKHFVAAGDGGQFSRTTTPCFV